MNTQTNARLMALSGLDHPMLDDERSRFVWYEGSAIAFQFMILAMLGLASAMVWFGGSEVRNWALALVFLTGITSAIAVRYGESQGVRFRWTWRELRRPRSIATILLGVLLAAGFVLGRSGSASVDPGFRVGLVCGAALAIGAAVWGTRRAERREARESELDLD